MNRAPNSMMQICATVLKAALFMAAIMAATDARAAFLRLACTPTVVNEGRDSVVFTRIEIDGSKWSVVHFVRSGASYDRMAQYSVKAAREVDSPQPSWQGENFKKPNISLTGRVVVLDRAYRYEEALYDSKLDGRLIHSSESDCIVADIPNGPRPKAQSVSKNIMNPETTGSKFVEVTPARVDTRLVESPPATPTPSREPECTPRELSVKETNAARSTIVRGFKDPEAVRIYKGRACLSPSGTTNGAGAACIYINAKNGYGGYNGRRLIYGVFVAGQQDNVFATVGSYDDDNGQLCARLGLKPESEE